MNHDVRLLVGSQDEPLVFLENQPIVAREADDGAGHRLGPFVRSIRGASHNTINCRQEYTAKVGRSIRPVAFFRLLFSGGDSSVASPGWR